jgi:HK97 family phage prohead protease
MSGTVIDNPEIASLRQEVDGEIFDSCRNRLQCELNGFFLDCPISEWRNYPDAPLARLTGMACPFNKKSAPLENYDGEFISRKAFSETIRHDAIRADVSHDAKKTFASTIDGSLRLLEKVDGLYAIILILNSPLGQKIVDDIRGGHLTGMSISYRRDSMESYLADGKRILCRAKLSAVSLCKNPAYPDTLGKLKLEFPSL